MLELKVVEGQEYKKCTLTQLQIIEVIIERIIETF